MPEGWRPPKRQIFTVMRNDVLGRLDIEANGNVGLFSTSGGGWLSLDGISFYTF